MSDDKAYMHLQHYGGIASNHIIIENQHTHITSLLLAIDLLISSIKIIQSNNIKQLISNRIVNAIAVSHNIKMQYVQQHNIIEISTCLITHS